MRVVDRKTFLTLPEGTAYQKGKPWVWNGLCFKQGNTPHNDWIYTAIDDVESHDSGEAVDRLEEMLETGKSYPIEDATSRDGFYNDDDLFLIYEAGDLIHLQGLIEKAFVVCTLREPVE